MPMLFARRHFAGRLDRTIQDACPGILTILQRRPHFPVSLLMAGHGRNKPRGQTNDRAFESDSDASPLTRRNPSRRNGPSHDSPLSKHVIQNNQNDGKRCRAGARLQQRPLSAARESGQWILPGQPSYLLLGRRGRRSAHEYVDDAAEHERPPALQQERDPPTFRDKLLFAEDRQVDDERQGAEQ